MTCNSSFQAIQDCIFFFKYKSEGMPINFIISYICNICILLYLCYSHSILSTCSPYHMSLSRFGFEAQMWIWSALYEMHSRFILWSALSRCVVCMAQTPECLTFCPRDCPNRLVVFMKTHTHKNACLLSKCLSYQGVQCLHLCQFICRMHVQAGGCI